MVHKRILTCFLLCIPVFAGAQDLHFSQPYHTPLHYTPAQTGVFRGSLRAMGIYRSQWSSVPVSYRTLGAAFDTKAWEYNGTTVGAGLQLQHDKAGDAGLSWMQAGLSGSVGRQLSETSAFSVGIGLGLAQRRFDIAGLKFNNQWNGDIYDAALPAKENFNQSSGMQVTLSVGMNYRYEQAGSRSEANIGLGLFHLNQPVIGFEPGVEEQLPMRMTILANSALELNESYDLIVFGMGQRMGTAQSIQFGAGARFWLLPEQTAVQLTLSTRLNDALIPAVQYEYGNWTFGLSYDLNISDFNRATQRRGGFELAAVYRPMPAPPVKTFKSCPVF